MSTPDKNKKSLKEKAIHEFVEYWINVIYLTLMFAAFTQYRRLVLADYDITYTNYGFAVIEALVLGKVVMIGDVLRMGRGLGQKSLIYPTLYKTVIFTIFVAAFKMIEYVIKGLWKGIGVMGGIDEFLGKGPNEIIANSLVVMVAFIPFFALKELERVLGKDKIRALLFRRRAEQ